MNKKKFSITNIGSVSLLMIFIILCMVTLAALSLSSTAADEKAAKRLADHNTQYYQACNQAEETLDIIDGILAESYALSFDSASYFSEVKTRLATLNTNINLNISTGNTPADSDLTAATNDSATPNGTAATNDSATPNDTAATNDSAALDYTATLDYTAALDDSRSLKVKLTLNDPWRHSSGFYTITSWKEVQTDEWTGDHTLNLIR